VVLEFEGGAEDKVAGKTNREEESKKPASISSNVAIFPTSLDAKGKKENDGEPDDTPDKNGVEIVRGIEEKDIY